MSTLTRSRSRAKRKAHRTSRARKSHSATVKASRHKLGGSFSGVNMPKSLI